MTVSLPQEHSCLEQPRFTMAVFLDRDGTLNVEKGYLRQVEDLVLYPGAASAIRRLNDAGILAILTTNQTGAARGFYPESHIQALHQRLAHLLWQEAEARLDAVYYSPYYERGVVPELTRASTCRKPGIGMIEQACQRFPELALSRSFVVGDKATDVEMAHRAGCRGILLKTGYGQRVLEGKYQSLTHQPWAVCADIAEAVQHILLAQAQSASTVS